jgi:hypothetical protein
VKIALLSFSEEVVVNTGEMHGVELVTMTTKEHIFLSCNCFQQEIYIRQMSCPLRVRVSIMEDIQKVLT